MQKSSQCGGIGATTVSACSVRPDKIIFPSPKKRQAALPFCHLTCHFTNRTLTRSVAIGGTTSICAEASLVGPQDGAGSNFLRLVIDLDLTFPGGLCMGPGEKSHCWEKVPCNTTKQG